MATVATARIPQLPSPTGSHDQLFETLYLNLRSQAQFYLHRERHGHSLSPTLLVHEAYISLAKTAGPGVTDANHFVHLASRVMRNWLIDWARSKNAVIHGGGLERIDLSEARLGDDKDPVQVVLVARAMAQLEATRPDLALLVELRFFAGLDEAETAQAINLSVRQTRRKWAAARELLLGQVQ